MYRQAPHNYFSIILKHQSLHESQRKHNWQQGMHSVPQVSSCKHVHLEMPCIEKLLLSLCNKQSTHGAAHLQAIY